MIKVELKELKNGVADKVAVFKDDDKAILTINLERNPEAFEMLNLLSQYNAVDLQVIDNVEEKGKIKYYRELAGLTHDQLADMVGCSRQTLSKIENGTSEPKLSLAIKIADVLHMDVRNIL